VFLNKPDLSISSFTAKSPIAVTHSTGSSVSIVTVWSTGDSVFVSRWKRKFLSSSRPGAYVLGKRSCFSEVKTAWVWCNHSPIIYSVEVYPFKAQWLLNVPPCLTFTNSTFCPHSVFACFVWISEQTAIISLFSINWLVCITETECVYCAVRTVFMCFVLISEHTAIISLYIINWLVCITETDCVYCAVRTAFMCFVWISERTAIISLYSINWLVCITETECVYCAVRAVFMCFVWISERTAIISLYNINWLVCITETECVYCAVPT
jgi:hypothetical protein